MAKMFREKRLSPSRLWSPLAPLVLALAALVFGLDQTHKWWMLNVFDIAKRQPVSVTSFFDLVLTWNKGISYGLLPTQQQGLLIALSIIVSLILWIWACRSRSIATVAALAIIIGGALSNALDRVFHGAVADFFHFHLGSFSWYVFNLADVAIVAGVIVLLYESFVGERHGNT
ncbi:MAG: signal peptidase II [Aestuariivirga sp.]